MKFLSRFFDKVEPIDPLDLDDDLFAAYPGRDKYSKLDIYRDFRKVFLETPEGKRVLHQLFSWARMDQTSIPPREFPDRNVWISEGQRNIGLKLRGALFVVPPTKK